MNGKCYKFETNFYFNQEQTVLSNNNIVYFFSKHASKLKIFIKVAKILSHKFKSKKRRKIYD